LGHLAGGDSERGSPWNGCGWAAEVPNAILRSTRSQEIFVGLRSELFDFADGIPTLVQIESKVRDLLDQPFSLRGSLGATPSDEERAKHTTRKTVILLRTNNVTFMIDLKKRGPIKNKLYLSLKRVSPAIAHMFFTVRTYATVNTSLNGKILLVSGNDNRLIDALCITLASLGGCIRVRPGKTTGKPVLHFLDGNR
jgi:hypothetical protein